MDCAMGRDLWLGEGIFNIDLPYRPSKMEHLLNVNSIATVSIEITFPIEES